MELPEGKKVLIFCFNVLLKNSGGSARSIDDAVEDMRPLMLLVFYFVDKVRKRKSDALAKAEMWNGGYQHQRGRSRNELANCPFHQEVKR